MFFKKVFVKNIIHVRTGVTSTDFLRLMERVVFSVDLIPHRDIISVVDFLFFV